MAAVLRFRFLRIESRRPVVLPARFPRPAFPWRAAGKGAMNGNTLRVVHKKFIFTGIPNAEKLWYTYSSKISKEKLFLIQSYSEFQVRYTDRQILRIQ